MSPTPNIDGTLKRGSKYGIRCATFPWEKVGSGGEAKTVTCDHDVDLSHTNTTGTYFSATSGQVGIAVYKYLNDRHLATYQVCIRFDIDG